MSLGTTALKIWMKLIYKKKKARFKGEKIENSFLLEVGDISSLKFERTSCSPRSRAWNKRTSISMRKEKWERECICSLLSEVWQNYVQVFDSIFFSFLSFFKKKIYIFLFQGYGYIKWRNWKVIKHSPGIPFQLLGLSENLSKNEI